MAFRWGNFFTAGVSAIYTPAAGEVDRTDPADPSNAPAISPGSHVDKVKWHSDWFQYQLLVDPFDVTVSHAAVAGQTTLVQQTSQGGLSLYRRGQSVGAYHTLYTHSLGYVPKFMVAYGGAILTTGTNVQPLSNRGRHVTAYATDTIIGLYDLGISSDVDLPATSVTYKVLLFNTPAAGSEPLFKFDEATGVVTMGKGKVSSAYKYARRVQPSESAFDINLGPTMDGTNGGIRVVSGGNVYSDYDYDGAFTGPDYLPIGGVF